MLIWNWNSKDLKIVWIIITSWSTTDITWNGDNENLVNRSQKTDDSVHINIIISLFSVAIYVRLVLAWTLQFLVYLIPRDEMKRLRRYSNISTGNVRYLFELWYDYTNFVQSCLKYKSHKLRACLIFRLVRKCNSFSTWNE